MLTSLGMTVLVVIPGFFLFSNLLWVVVVLRCNKERLNTAAELDRLEHRAGEVARAEPGAASTRGLRE